MITPNQPLTEPQKKYIEALRSGKRIQIKGYLHNGSGFCALGVACDVFKDELKLEVGDRADAPRAMVSYDGYWYSLPSRLVQHLGLHNDAGTPQSDDGCFFSISNMNDHRHMSFKEIANVLEQNPHLYFKPECKS